MLLIDSDVDKDLYSRMVSLSINAIGITETRSKKINIRYIIKALSNYKLICFLYLMLNMRIEVFILLQ